MGKRVGPCEWPIEHLDINLGRSSGRGHSSRTFLPRISVGGCGPFKRSGRTAFPSALSGTASNTAKWWARPVCDWFPTSTPHRSPLRPSSHILFIGNRGTGTRDEDYERKVPSTAPK